MPEGDHLFRADTSTSTDLRPTIVQGGIESSNVSPMLEMTNMMQLGRDFQFMSQFRAERVRTAAKTRSIRSRRNRRPDTARLDRGHTEDLSMRSLDIAATGMQAQQTNVEVISNKHR